MYKKLLYLVLPLIIFSCSDGLTYDQKIKEYNSYIKITDSLIDIKDYKEAIKYANTAISITDTLSPAFIKKGIACYELNWLEFAEENFDEAIEIEGESSAVYKARALVYLKNNDSDFLDDIDNYLIYFPNDEEAHILKREYFENKEDYGNAISEYNHAIEKYKDSTELYIKRSNLLYLNGDYDETLTDYDKILNLDESNTIILNKKRELLAKLNKKKNMMIFIALLLTSYGAYILLSFYVLKPLVHKKAINQIGGEFKVAKDPLIWGLPIILVITFFTLFFNDLIPNL
ncbi:tetratricopeptide repeat protein [Winogradskyella helgolandensis]|uniref:tetratricopeptide repeat protein n=1 Tax=Winogradskyella helgolandensis TaxID=2697010 RepID=UPI0015C1BB50|nr:hypothetical protein [Winogradskyella helgolandensis]